MQSQVDAPSTRRLMPIAVLALAAFGCGDDSAPAESIGSQLTRGLDFRGAMILSGEIPAPPTAPDVTILPLGGSTVASPGGGGIMALEVDDPEGRAPAATLMQFGGSDEHLRVPVPDDQEGDVIENVFTAPEDLCEGLCNTLYSMTVLVAIELEGGEVGPAVEQTIVIDCTEHGDPEACDVEPGPPEEGITEGLVCGSLADGELVLSGVPELDRFVDAVAQVERSGAHAEGLITEAMAELADALGLPSQSGAGAIAAELTAQVAASTQDGVGATVGERGCGVVSQRAVSTLGSCDPDGADVSFVECLGECEPKNADAACATGAQAGCYGRVQSFPCGGTCIGACTLPLAMATSCDGTCSGECSGMCPDDGSGGCDGPCVGLCTGECTTPSTAGCSGTCSGLCDEATEAACDAPTRRTCTAETEPAGCTGVCYGEASVPDAIEICELAALSLGRMFPRCDASIVQLGFTFAEGLSPSEQDAFAALSAALAAPLARLLDARARAEAVALAGNDLDLALSTLAQDALDAALLDPPEGSDPACAETALMEAGPLLTVALDSLGMALADAGGLLSDPIVIAQ